MDKHFWKGKKVLITGFEGFLGSNLTKALLCSGAKIYGLDIKIKRNDTILTAADYKRLTVIKGSVADYKLVEGIIRRSKINVIFHLAAEAIVGKCLDDPLCAFSTNIKGTWNILEACRKAKGIWAIIIASSDKAYGSHQKLPYTEEAPLQGKHPYDVSKSCADLLADTYAHTYKLPVAVTRCGNIYGPGDFNFSRIVPDAVRCALKSKKLLIRSDGKFTRDYVFVEDIVSGYIILAEKLQKLKLSGEAFNFSDENPLTVVELVKAVSKAANSRPNYKILNKVKYEIKHQYLSSAKARKILGWKPLFNLRAGLMKTIAAYKEYFRIPK
ncbi:MAG: GDP-mannose 4,6-dehydratase [Candidatus Omnitrophica bacterium]|nr:GDP-mannose 4,6-dehydratase [Candidatus Omnitrophota bacterium]